MKHVMVVNMGMKSIRCIIFDENGNKLSCSAIAINTAINEKQVEQNPTEWWDKAKLVMGQAFLESSVKKIDYITVTASASCLVCIDGKGDPLGKALMVSDKRAVEETRFLRMMPEFETVRKDTGLEMSASLMLPKILWIKRNRPEVFEKTKYFLSPNDYLIYKMCGHIVTDYFNAMKYHYDPETKRYPLELLEKLEIPLETLPQVANTGECVGKVSSGLAKNIGINDDAEVVLSSYDAVCSFIGSGVTDEGEASDVSGTVTVFRALSRKNDLKENSIVYNMPFYQEQAHIIGGSNNLGGGLIEWVKQCYYQKEECPYEIMEKDARESEIGARGLIFLPYLLGERAPLWDDTARGVFFGLERMHTRKDMTRAVFESTGFIDRDIIDAIQATGVNVTSVRLSGGLTRLHFVSQIKADILGRDVMVLSEFETTSSGAAMMVLLGQDVYQNLKDIAEKFATVRMIIKPDMENYKKYTAMYGLYKDTYDALKGLFSRRLEVLEHIRDDKTIQIENL